MTATPALAKRCDACDEATSVLLTITDSESAAKAASELKPGDWVLRDGEKLLVGRWQKHPTQHGFGRVLIDSTPTMGRCGTRFIPCNADEEFTVVAAGAESAPAPGCYCSISIKCDYCQGLRVWGVSELGTPAAVKSAAARIGTTSLALARYSTRHLREAGFVIEGRRAEGAAA